MDSHSSLVPLTNHKVVLRESRENEVLQAVVAMQKGTEFDATVWTQDSDFKKVGGVKYFPKK